MSECHHISSVHVSGQEERADQCNITFFLSVDLLTGNFLDKAG